MSSEWHYTKDNHQHGPISAASLKQLADNGGLRPDDLVCQEGSDHWVAAKRVKGLFSSPPPIPPAAEEPVAEGPVAEGPVAEPLPQIQINVGKTLRGIGTNRPRHGRVWSKLTTQHKIIAVSVAGCGVLMMLCVIGSIGAWMLGNSGRETAGNFNAVPAVTLSDQRPPGWNPVNNDVLKEVSRRKPNPDLAAAIMWKHWDEREELDKGFLYYRWRDGGSEIVLIYEPSGAFRQAVASGELGNLSAAHKSKWQSHLANLTGTSSSSTTNDPRLATAVGFTKRALSIPREKRKAEFHAKLVQHKAGSRGDMLQAIGILLGDSEITRAQNSKVVLGKDDGVPDAVGATWAWCGLHLDRQTWHDVFGAPELLSDRHDFYFGKVNKFNRWRYQCSDGPITFHGNVLPGDFGYSAARICFY
jgi:hypothetical protein